MSRNNQGRSLSSGHTTSGDGQPQTSSSTDGSAVAQAKKSAGIDAATAKRSRARRLRLSCAICRSKKLSCDRKWPCQRCVRTGRPEQCSFETGRPLPNLRDTDQAGQTTSQPSGSQIQDLRAEVARLKHLLSIAGQQNDDIPHDSETLGGQDTISSGQAQQLSTAVVASPSHITEGEIVGLRGRSPRGYYRQHALFQFFDEIPQLFPFIRETADEWFRPRGVSLRKSKITFEPSAPSVEAKTLEELLPPKEDTDILVSFYLDHVEQLHRIIHIPTFKREYALVWVPRRPRYPGTVALVLAISALSTSLSSNSSASEYRGMPPKWISACDSWLAQQTMKGRRLIYYQVACLVYLGKRTNTIRKKRFWIETGSLIQNAILDRLHCDPEPSSTTSSPYVREMRRRIWSVLRESDLQNSFEYELPTLLHSIECNIAGPSNLDDEEFDETTKILPIHHPLSQKTDTSYQALCSRSWALRLEISRRLFGTGLSKALPYDNVLWYTHTLTREIDSLPCWNREGDTDSINSANSLLVSALLRFQLKECILAIHRPYLREGNDRFSISEIICYHTSRDILLLNRELADFGIQSLALLREDLLVAALSLTRITLLHPADSTNVAAASAASTIDLLEQCLPFTEDRYLRCFYGEPWCPLTMHGAIMLLKIQMGKDSRQTAKSTCAQRFLGLYYKHFARQETFDISQRNSNPRETTSVVPTSPTNVSTSNRLEPGYAELGFDSFDFDSFCFDMDWQSGSSWDMESPWNSLPVQSVGHFDETSETCDGT